MGEGKTKMIVEIEYPDGDVTRFKHTINKWDLDAFDIGNMFRQMMGAMGFTEHSVGEVFGEEDDVPDAVKDDCVVQSYIGCFAPQAVSPVPESIFVYPTKAPNTGPEYLDLDFQPYLDEEDPCFGCDVSCDDTACLFDEDDEGDLW